jgi:glycosyltransferase involved in cell wall biosynthesis
VLIVHVFVGGTGVFAILGEVMRILYVTRKYPPSTGGMENAALELYQALAATNDVTLVKWGGANKLLPIVYPGLFVQALVLGLQNRPDVIYMQDGLMAPMGWLLKLLLRRPTVMTIHGKEATYANPLYQLMVPPFVRKQTLLVTVSNETADTVRRAFPASNPLVIFNGLTDSFYTPDRRDHQYAAVAAAVGMKPEELKQYKLLHTNGRLVRRKGVLWFVDQVLPRLVAERQVMYIVSGAGKDQEVIESAIADRGLQNNVRLLGRIPGALLNNLYNVADMFVMPNIPVANDMEGFGLVALEAASCGTTVVASKLEGIQDAIIDGKNGHLVQPTNADQYTQVILRELHKPTLQADAVRRYTLENYSWVKVAKQYEAAMQRLVSHS